MRQHKYNYRVLDKLPKAAMTIKDYADQRNCNTSYIYKLWRQAQNQGKGIDFEIVLFHNINFILPV